MPASTLRHARPNEQFAAFLDAVRETADRGRTALLAQQKDDGHWVGELEGDTILESEFILLLAFLGQEHQPRVRKIANYLLAKQLPDGGWPNFPGGPSEISVSVKAYFALKIAGHAADEPLMQRAAATIRKLGGAAACNSFTRFYLALLGQISYDNCPTVPVEMVLLPRWFYFNIYAMSAWSRTIVVPLAVVNAYRPVRELPPAMGVRELFLEDPATPWTPTVKPPRFSWANAFLKIDTGLKFAERIGFTPFRRWALRKAVAWMRERFASSDGLGAIFPPMIYTVVVLKCLGVPETDPEYLWAMKQLDDLAIEEGDTLRLQPCVSPVWDTALSLIGATDAGQPGDSAESTAAVAWLLDKEVRTPGDWVRTAKRCEPGGWFFEYANAFYPDTDDTSMVLIALSKSGHAKNQPAVQRAVNWLLAMQNSDGGWAAFDRNINKEILTKVPFADHNAMLDPSCPDISARILESLSHYGHRVGQKHVDAAIAFIARTQEADGSWFGRWGVNYVYGTWQVLAGLSAIGFDMTAPMARRGVRWLKENQNADGGWGETCRSYDDPSLAGQGESTPSQTAWALLGLLAAGETDSPEVRAGIEYLVGEQNADGTWTEEPFTGTGFPKVFYLKYHLYAHYFPLMALGRYAQLAAGDRG
ncbi:squalene--hopene cyclase [Limnoglobus roseus]|uniref:Squalene--hopene cyclase n=1 Tax=Limnoglobus roseus TaxID=2598579 RepID=A0A5C1A7I8_9BACT|nr:squalene--hopene cyclase [Limnoglobus roseus]QEL15259.1 squalene--hopene cyclase [Limnoglobus roseus]